MAQHILEKKKKANETDISMKAAIHEMTSLLTDSSEFAVDYERLADEWITIFQPYLNEKRAKNRNRKVVYNLNNLKSEWKSIHIDSEMLQGIIENNPIVEDVDSKIASCIIGIENT